MEIARTDKSEVVGGSGRRLVHILCLVDGKQGETTDHSVSLYLGDT